MQQFFTPWFKSLKVSIWICFNSKQRFPGSGLGKRFSKERLNSKSDTE